MSIGIYKMTARDVMTRRPDTIGPDETIHDVIETMVQLDLSALPVVDGDNRCVGVVSKTDIVRLAGQVEQSEKLEGKGELAALLFGVFLDEITGVLVKDVMSTDVLNVREDESITTIADQMLKRQVHHVPVCNAQDRVTGVVSSMDLVKAIREPLNV